MQPAPLVSGAQPTAGQLTTVASILRAASGLTAGQMRRMADLSSGPGYKAFRFALGRARTCCDKGVDGMFKAARQASDERFHGEVGDARTWVTHTEST